MQFIIVLIVGFDFADNLKVRRPARQKVSIKIWPGTAVAAGILPAVEPGVPPGGTAV